MYATKQVLLCLALSASANAMGGSAVPQGLESDVDPVSFTETRMIEDPSKVGKKCGPYQNGAVNTPRAFDNRVSPGFVATEVACSAKCLELETCVAYSMGVMPSDAPGNLEPDDGRGASAVRLRSLNSTRMSSTANPWTPRSRS